MFNLEELNTGSTCTITWLLGQMGTWLKDTFGFNEDDNLKILYNDGNSIIVAKDEHRYAMDYETAHAIKVTV
ncbi:MAG: FeoA domain-containing protein [Erysipelotrichaceae bacterium]|nr:FeoA domain-containing protein [Erysipelotrichaceae bacterium]